MKRKIKTSPIGHGEDERWPGRRYTLEKPGVAVDGAATSLRDRVGAGPHALHAAVHLQVAAVTGRPEPFNWSRTPGW